MIRWAPRPLWREVMEELRERILSGVYEPESPIPSVRVIMQEWEVGRNTALHAVASLEEQGYVVRVQSLGTFVRPREEWPAERG